MSPLEIVGGFIDGAANIASTWRPLLCAMVVAPFAGLIYLLVPNGEVGEWLAAALLCVGLLRGLVWERWAVNKGLDDE